MPDENTVPEPQNRPSESSDRNSGTHVPSGNSDAENRTEGSDEKDSEISIEYVRRLRSEAKEARLKAQRADFLATEVRRLAIREAARSAGLIDAEALTWSDEYADPNTGLPDHDQLRQAAEALAAEHPWLARPRGPLPGQGQHGTEDQAPSLSALLRA